VTSRFILWPRPVQIAFIAVGALIIGGRASIDAAGHNATTIVVAGRPRTVVSTRTVRRVLEGRIVHREDRVYVLVPQIVVRTDDHVIRVPAHRLRLRSAAASVAILPASTQVTVYIPVPPVTVTTTATETQTIIVPPTTVTTTISLPIDSS